MQYEKLQPTAFAVNTYVTKHYSISHVMIT